MSFRKATLVLLGSGHGDALQDPAGIQLQREHLPINPAGQHLSSPGSASSRARPGDQR